MERVALFGGTFDPIHRGHVFIAEKAYERCALDRVIFIPCWQSPHKQGVKSAPAEDRLRMIELAIADLPWAEASRWEIDRKEPSYSWQTVEHFTGQQGEDAVLHWILGMDQWAAIEKWARIDYLASMVKFIVFPRDGEFPQEKSDIEATFLPDAMKVSATAIRSGKSSKDLLSDAVSDYIVENQLYRSYEL